MTEKEKPSDDFMERAAEISMEWIDIIPVARALQDQYQQGYDAGLAANAVASQAEYQKGYDAARADIFNAMESVRRAGPPTEKPRAPITSDIQEVKTEPLKVPAEPEPDPPKGDFIAEESGAQGDLVRVRPLPPSEPEKRTGEPEKAPLQASEGGRPRANDDRPIHCPTNLEMAVMALKELKEPSSAPAILMFVRNRWWGNCPDAWKSTLIEFAKRGKLRKDGLNYLLPLTPQEKIDGARKNIVQEQPHVLPKEPVNIPIPAVRPAAGPRREVVTPGAKLGPPARQEGVEFKHGEHSVTLHHREVTIVTQLRYAMGKGHLDAKFLANLIGIKGEAELTMREMVTILNPKIATLGLQIDFFRGFGFIMKET